MSVKWCLRAKKWRGCVPSHPGGGANNSGELGAPEEWDLCIVEEKKQHLPESRLW